MKLILIISVSLLLGGIDGSQDLIDNNAKYECGVKRVQSTDEFVAVDGSWPWAVGVTDEEANVVTSGTLISAFYVITSKKSITNSTKMYILPGDISNDLAILELDQPLQFSDYIIPICLPSFNDYSKVFGKNLTLTGWADLQNIFTDTQLLETRVRVLDECECSPNMYRTLDLTQDLCFYDFGSGLYYSENGIWYLYGVTNNTSEVLLCNNSATNKIYHTIIPKNLGWINESMNRTKPDPEVFVTNEPDNFCGKPDIEPNTKIINGIPSIPNSWPWTVALWGQSIGELSYYCGGTIISRRFILTAAHCVYSKDLRYFISIGTRKLTFIENFENMYLVKRVITNGYDSLSLRNDIAILELAKPIRFNKRVSRVCLPFSSDENEVFNRTLFVAGWGSTNIQPVSDEQLQTKLRVMNFISDNSTLCRSRDWFEYCTIDEVNDSNVCHGDSGSGLVYFKNKRWYIYGIVSHGITYFGYCDNTRPSHHTMVPKYLDWIQRATRANFKSDKYFVDFS